MPGDSYVDTFYMRQLEYTAVNNSDVEACLWEVGATTGVFLACNGKGWTCWMAGRDCE